uniref:Uncharacterized protein n=1 Tax=Physcomitrium patens TaxID=3218 RepID=A0A2K1LAK4_PHYPA|nr:hypothetical protein PHYPA_001484 [Physcomitrium patens]
MKLMKKLHVVLKLNQNGEYSELLKGMVPETATLLVGLHAPEAPTIYTNNLRRGRAVYPASLLPPAAPSFSRSPYHTEHQHGCCDHHHHNRFQRGGPQKFGTSGACIAAHIKTSLVAVRFQGCFVRHCIGVVVFVRTETSHWVQGLIQQGIPQDDLACSAVSRIIDILKSIPPARRPISRHRIINRG